MHRTEKIHDVRVHLDENNGDTYVELEGSIDLPTEDRDDFLDELGNLVRHYHLG